MEVETLAFFPSEIEPPLEDQGRFLPFPVQGMEILFKLSWAPVQEGSPLVEDEGWAGGGLETGMEAVVATGKIIKK